jgi:hypothetical protein
MKIRIVSIKSNGESDWLVPVEESKERSWWRKFLRRPLPPPILREYYSRHGIVWFTAQDLARAPLSLE